MGIKIFGVFFVGAMVILGCEPTMLSGKIAESAGGPTFTTADADPDVAVLVEDAEVDAVIDAAPADIHPVVDAEALPDMAEQIPDVDIPDASPTPPDAAPDATEDVPLPDAAALPVPEVQFSRVVFRWQRGNTPIDGDVSSLNLWVQCETQKHHRVVAFGDYAPDPQSEEISLGMWYPANEGAQCHVTLVVNDALAWGVLPPGTCTHSIEDGPPQDDPVIDDPESPYFGTWSAQLD